MKILDYELKSLAGRGAFSEVWRAEKNSRPVAIKLLNAVSVSSAALLESLRFEFWVLKDLRHPNVVTVHDFGATEDGRVFLAEEWLDGTDLKTFCRGKSFSECE